MLYGINCLYICCAERIKYVASIKLFSAALLPNLRIICPANQWVYRVLNAYFASPELIVCLTAVAVRVQIKEVETGRTKHCPLN